MSTNMSIDTTAWLGDAAADLDTEQREQFDRLVGDYHETVVARRPYYGTEDYDDRDYEDEDTAAWVAAFELAAGTLNLEARGRAFIRTRTDAQQAAIISVLAGEKEAVAARHAAVSRPWLRKQLGK